MLDNVAVKNRVYGLIELDVTKAREYMRNYEKRTCEMLSFTGWMVRKANEKSFRQIHDEICAAQAQKVTGPALGNERMLRILAVFQRLPIVLRRIGWWKFRGDPFLKKQIMGAVGVTTLGMFGKGSTRCLLT